MKKKVRGVFITATDTEVGKTVVGCALAVALKRNGVEVGVAKPFATDGQPDPKREGQLVNADVRLLKRFAKVDDPVDAINPVCLKAPLAPAVAARLEGAKVNMAKTLSATQRLMRRHQFTIVEGCGGLLAPVTEHLMVIDFIERLGLPALIVSRAGLGTINHTLLSVMALQQRNIELAGIVLNRLSAGSDQAIHTNAEEIQRHCSCPVLGPLPFIPSFRATKPNIEQLSQTTALKQLAGLIYSTA